MRQSVVQQRMSSVLWLCACGILVTGSLGAVEEASAPRYDISMEEIWIPMPDDVRLAADLYMPTGGEPSARIPVLLEYLPYRKTESRSRNYSLYSYFVRRGYAVARVDIRGTGNSEGRLIPFEYSDQENEDGEAVIDWLSKQPWSNGNVGMFGISWGGFNAIHLAMRNPPALKAIIAVDATDDLYQDDVHFMDGVIHVDSWEMSQDLDNARPGAPDYRIDEAYFRDRFDTQPWMMTYKRQQRDGPFWDRTALRVRYDSIHVPTFVIGGWYDGYRDSVPRMLEHLQAPTKAIIGAWHHSFPHNAYPKPQIEWRHEAVRWFDYWLKGKDTGIMGEPRFAVYVRQWHPPGPYLEEAPGEWRWEEGWPIERIEERVLYPQPNHTLEPAISPKAIHQLRYVPSIGIEAGGPVMWWGDVAHDQRPTDAFSLVYDSDALESEVEILGLPRVLLKVSADAPVRASVRRGPGRHGHSGRRCRVQRYPPRIGSRTEVHRARGGISPRDRDALHLLGLPCGPPHSPGSGECPVADALAHPISDDDQSLPRKQRRHARSAACRSPPESPRPLFPPSRRGSGNVGVRKSE